MLTERMCEQGVDLALITDDDSVYYFTGFYDYLHMEFGRPTLLLVWRDGETLLITPSIDYNSALDHARVDRIEPWNDGMGNEWREHLPAAIDGGARIAIEPDLMPPPVKAYVASLTGGRTFDDITPIIAEMRMVKSDEELQLARHAGEVASAMMQAGRDAIRGDPSDSDFWDRMITSESVELVMLALPRVSTSLAVVGELERSGYRGEVAAIARYPDEEDLLDEAGVGKVFNIYSEVGAGFASNVIDTLEQDEGNHAGL